MAQNQVASGLLLVLIGVWLLVQATAGDLGRRLLSWANPDPVTSPSAGTGSGLGGAIGGRGGN